HPLGVHRVRKEGKQWTLDNTREWLEKHGMRFSTTALRRFINIYVTYMKPDAYDMDLENKSLIELCEEIEQEIESLFVPDSLPTQVFEALFPSLEPPKDKKTARELICEASSSGGLLSQAGRVYRPWKKWV
ncbi:MAG: hypothetical protein DRP38_04870, partial [Thermotogae bacterium]